MRAIHCLIVCLLVHWSLAGVVVEKGDRTIDISSHLAKETVSLTIGTDGEAVSSVQVSFDAEHLSYVYASIKDKEVALEGPVHEEHRERDVAIYTVQLPKTLSGDQTVVLETYAVYTNTQVPLPKKQPQSSRPAVVYSGSYFISSPYSIKAQVTKIETGTNLLIDYSERKPTKLVNDRTIKYGTYKNSKVFPYQPLRIHYENFAVPISVGRLVREIEISHWGNVAVSETFYEMKHKGASLDGPFSRLDYQHGVIGNSVEELRMTLPADATDVYYRDVIGNISTSHVSLREEGVLFEFKPRFVMFGGWKTAFCMGYNVPAHTVLSSSGSSYELSIDFAKDFEDAVIEEMEIRVILPEHSSNIQVNSPHPIYDQEDDTIFTYLDYAGRPVTKFKAYNLVSDHNDKFTVTYTFGFTSLFYEPMMLTVGFFAAFVCAMVIVRIDLSISAEPESSGLSAADIEAVNQIRTRRERRADAYNNFTNALNKFQADKNLGNAEGALKKLTSVLNAIGREAEKHMEGDILQISVAIEKREASRAALTQEQFGIYRTLVTKSKGDEYRLEEIHRELSELETEIATLIEELPEL